MLMRLFRPAGWLFVLGCFAAIAGVHGQTSNNSSPGESRVVSIESAFDALSLPPVKLQGEFSPIIHQMPGEGRSAVAPDISTKGFLETTFRKKRKSGGNTQTRFDLSEYMPRPGKQKENDCMAWALAYSYSCQVRQDRYGAAKSDYEPCDQFSPAYIYESIGSNGDSLEPQKAIDFVRKDGCASMATMPQRKKTPSSNAVVEAKTFCAQKSDTVTRLDQIKDSIRDGYPVILCVRLDDEFRNPERPSAPYKWSGKKTQSNHAICAVGFDDRKDAIKILNSAGPDWKDSGYCWVSYDTIERVGRKFWCARAYVVKIKASYPINVETDNRHFFTVKDDHKVYDENGRAISPKGWQIDNIACTKHLVCALRRNDTVAVMKEDGAGGASGWTMLDFGELRRQKVAMIAGTSTCPLHVLTSGGDVFEYQFKEGKNAGDGEWKPVDIPGKKRARTVDLRLVDREPRAVESSGEVFAYKDGQWQAVR